MRIITDEGLEGVAEVISGNIALDIIGRCIKPMLLGKDPLLKEDVWKDVWEMDRIEEFPLYIMGSVDVALWDLTAKKAGMPLYQIIGGNSDRVKAYASTVTYDNIDQYLRVADQCLDRGYRAIKLHAWGDVREDAKLAKRLRKHVGDDIDLMYDGSAGFNLQESILLGKHLEEAGYVWYEEPMREFNLFAYQKLCKELTIPVLAAETSDGCHYNAADWIVQEALDIVRVETDFKGGITGALRVAHLADAFGMKAEIHGGGLPNLHLACAIPNNSFFEVIVHHDPVLFFEDVDADGTIAPPRLPGTGLVCDWAEIEKRAYAKV